MTEILIFTVGLVFGSFINVLVGRLKISDDGSNKIDLKTPSHCDECQKKLTWYDLIPLVSFFFLAGKCRRCEAKIPLFVPLVELVSGAVALGLYYVFGLSFASLLLFFISLIMIATFVYDLKHQLIPDLYIWIMLILALTYNLYLYLTGDFLFNSVLIAVLVGSGFFWLINLVSKGNWMGLGDVKLMLVIGLVLGWPLILVQLYASFIIGGIIGLILILASKKGMKNKIAFGPFLVVGFFISLFWGEAIVLLVSNYLFL